MYSIAPKRRGGEGESGSPLDQFERPESSWHGEGTSHTVPERTQITPEHRERMLNTPQTEEEERAMDLFDTSLESGGISRGRYPIWNKMRVAGEIDYAKNIFDVIHHWNPKWGRPPDLHPNASEEEIQAYYAAAVKLKEDWIADNGFMPAKPNIRAIIEQENKLSPDWNQLIHEHGFLPPRSGKGHAHPDAEMNRRVREEMGHDPHNSGKAERHFRSKMDEAGIPHAWVRPIQPHVAETFHQEHQKKFFASEEGQQMLRDELLETGDLSNKWWGYLQEHPELEHLGMGPGDLPNEIKEKLPVLQPLQTLQPDWAETFMPRNPGDVSRAVGELTGGESSVVPELNPVSRMFTPEQEEQGWGWSSNKKGKPMDLAWRLLKQTGTYI
jgi:hypothetical protein